MEIGLWMALMVMLIMRVGIFITELCRKTVALQEMGRCFSCRSFGRAGGSEPRYIYTCWNCNSAWFFRNGCREEWDERGGCEYYEAKRER